MAMVSGKKTASGWQVRFRYFKGSPHIDEKYEPDYRHGYPAAQELALVENGNEIIDTLNVSTDEEQIRRFMILF